VALTIAGGAVAGAFVAGPIGAAIGAAIGLAVVPGVKTIAKVAEVPAGLLKDVWRGLLLRAELIDKLPKVGLIRLDRMGKPVPPAISDVMMSKDVNSTLFKVVPVTVKGLDLDTVRSGAPLSAAQQSALADAVTALTKQGAIAITADSGMFVHYQAEATKHTTLPVLLSPLLQAPLVTCVLSAHESVLTITCDARTFGQAELEATLLKHGLAENASAAKRFILRGLEHVPGFDDAAKPIDVMAAESALIDLVKSECAALGKAGRPVGAVLLESAMLPAFSDVLRASFPLPVFDNFTLSDFAHKATTDNPRFGIEFGSTPRKGVNDPSTKKEMPSVGIMRIDYTYPPALGDAAHPNSYYYRTPHATIKGLSFEAAQVGGPLTAAQREAMAAAVAKLEAEGVMGIAGDCGFLINYQKDARAMCKRPCFISALLQCAMLVSLYAKDELVLVLTANGPALTPALPALLKICGISATSDHERFIVAGCEALPGFDAVARGEAVDVAKVQPHVVELVQAKVKANPKIRAVLLECTELPPYADAIRHALRLPVLDSITLVDYFHGAISENPYFGIDWQKLASTPAFE